ncbi:hypothetical protein NMY22_g18521 [Coprinellus aureogranulatus]|nr:hypothetical protein NMY22_g18521 [Coprinellus aureogranulatus]
MGGATAPPLRYGFSKYHASRGLAPLIRPSELSCYPHAEAKSDPRVPVGLFLADRRNRQYTVGTDGYLSLNETIPCLAGVLAFIFGCHVPLRIAERIWKWVADPTQAPARLLTSASILNGEYIESHVPPIIEIEREFPAE